MFIFVKPIYGRRFSIRVNMTDTIDIVKQKIHEHSRRMRSRIPVERMTLIFGDATLVQVNSTLQELGIFNGAMVLLCH